MKLLALSLLAASCGSSSPSTNGATVAFDLSSPLATPATFFDFPFPSDLRAGGGGGPSLQGFPNPRGFASVDQLRASAARRTGYPVIPVAYFKFSAALPPQDSSRAIAADPSSPLLLVDVDPSSPERGRLFPVVADVPAPDGFAPPNLLAVAPHPGFVLAGKRAYAFVVKRALLDGAGQPLGVPPALADLAAGRVPPGARGTSAQASFAPLWQTLATLKVAAADVAAATVFTTQDVVETTASIGTGLVGKHAATIHDLALHPDGDTYDRFCYLAGKVTMPQFQTGTAPFGSGGEFVFGDDGLPKKQGDLEVPMVITLPKAPMPSGGYPLVVYFHGSGGLSDEVVQRGMTHVKGGAWDRGKGPAYYHAASGMATAASALPDNPERVSGAGDFAYLNINNLGAFQDTFRQGVVEQRLFIAALRTLRIPPAALGGCAGPSLPAGATAYSFAPDKLLAQGQSMGGMYTNMVAATEPRVRAVVPTGAGGFWSFMMLRTRAIPHVTQVVGIILGTDEKLTFLHPGVHLIEMAWEPADPYVYMPRLARRPLPGHPVRPIYEPVGKDDVYFPVELYDAVALAYGNQEAGDTVWPTMQQSLALGGLDGIKPYPVKQNRTSADGTAYTGVVVQYQGDGIEDPHDVFQQLDAVKYQYGCFFTTFLSGGVAVVPAPAPLGTPCPQ